MFNNSTTRTVKYNVTSNIDGENLWEICQAIVTFCTILGVYVFLCLLWFHHKRNYSIVSKNHHDRSNLSETPKKAFYAQRPGYGEDTYRRRSGPNKKFKTWMLRVALFASFFALVKYFVDQMKFFYAWDARTDEACELANDLTEVVLYGITINCVYGFLWMRQWLFYNNPAVKGLLYRRCLIGFSKGLLVVIFSLSSILAVFHLLPQRYKADDLSKQYVGCISIYDMNNIDDAWPIFLYIVLTSAFQISLLGLFIYPFIKRKMDSFAHRKQGNGIVNIDHLQIKTSPSLSQRSSPYSTRRSTYERASNVNSPSTSRKRPTNVIEVLSSRQFLRMPNEVRDYDLEAGKKDTVKSRVKKNLWILCPKSKQAASEQSPIQIVPSAVSRQRNPQVFVAIRRVVFWCTMCIISDVTTVLVAVLKGPGTPLILITALNNVNILVNLLCIIATYSRWKEILFPLCNNIKHSSKMFGSAFSIESKHRIDETIVSRSPLTLHTTLEARVNNNKTPIIITSYAVSNNSPKI